jgi:hypothetical protein
MDDDPEILIRRLYDKVDRFFKAAQDAQPGALTCGLGCWECCRVDLTVFQVEARRVQNAISRLDAGRQAYAADRAERSDHCSMLDPDGGCVIYEHRPLICRSHGLAVLTDDRVDFCRLNYREEKPLPEFVMTLERLNELLVLTNRLAGGDGRRIRLADIARNPSQPV